MRSLLPGARRSSPVIAATLACAGMIAAGSRAEAAPPSTPAARAAPSASAPPAPASAPAPAAPSSAAPQDVLPAGAESPAAAGPPPAAAAVPPPAAAPPAAVAPLAAAPGSAPVALKRSSGVTTWDINVEGAVGYSWERDDHVSGFGRIRGGVLHMNDSDMQAPIFFALGATYELSDFSPATFGVQGEILSLNSGFWFQAGAMVDLQPRAGFMASLGLSLLGAEGQVRWSKDEGSFFAVFGKLRIPVGLIALAVRGK